MSLQNICIEEAYNRGYRVINGVLFNPANKQIGTCIHTDKKGYKRKTFNIKFSARKYAISLPIHKLVAYQKFGKLIFQSGIQVRHLDGNSLNNLEENIEIGNQSQNRMDIPKEKRLAISIKASSQKRRFSNEIVQEIKRKHKEGKTYKQLMLEYNISSLGTLSYLINTEYVTNK